ncbi:TetR/AcrR family transcriptional regulator [Thalassospira alkalitolerans]|uniref:Transcriptional regulator n=1 Tax=Thalassospira alkalitolerans TaxID=1293890 RepID=A0A1Y2LBX3_9PROT|nr:TetR/AcrR family transcriptional regulator [Thalassospira alkalitolerans]OSQ48297.1 transcriptional regulator [Thalassospira alkalitolerans]|tara:strand:- start:22358 stop:22978 length:621 start_codon:yes stop_codon:yes gene_type:complete
MNTRAGKREQTRHNILEAARKCFNAQGYDGASTREIAKTAGVAEGTVFSHFETKEDLLISSVGEHLADAIKKGLHTMDPEWCFVDKMMHIASFRFAQIALQPGLWRVILQQLVFTPRKGAVKELMRNSGLIEAMTRLIEDAQLDGELNPEIDPAAIHKTTMALFLFTIHEHVGTENYDCEDMCATLRELLEIQMKGIWLRQPELVG